MASATPKNMNFSAQVGAWVKQTKAALEGIFHESAQRVVEEMQKTVQEGGRMPVDTGFLRASLLASSEGMPVIRPGNRYPDGTKPGTYGYEAGPINLVINETPLGKSIFVGYTAEYAAHVNYGTDTMQPYLFVELAAQQWPAIVKKVEGELKARLGV